MSLRSPGLAGRPTRVPLLIIGSVLCLGWAIGAELVSTTQGFPGNHLLEFLSGLAFLGAGMYAIAVVPRNAIGWLLLSYGVLWFANFWAIFLPPLPEALVTVVANSQGALLVHVALVFPAGRIATRLSRGVVAFSYLWSLLAWFGLEATTDRSTWDCAHQFCRATLSLWLWPSASAYSAWDMANNVLTLLIVAGTVGAFWQRWRTSSPVGRRDLRVLWIAVALVSLTYAARSIASFARAGDAVFGVLNDLQAIAQMLAPLLIVYGLLTARMASSAVSTFVADARTAHPSQSLESALGRVLQDPGLRIARQARDGSWRDEAGVAIPADSPALATAQPVVGSDGTVHAALIHDPGLDASAVRAAAATAGLILENESLRDELAAQLAEVQASRARLVTAGDAERKRVERDLHDGAQQRLLSLAMALRTARRQSDADDPELSHTLELANAELLLAIDELRTLARGIHPAILTDAGLAAAVRALVDRSPLEVEMRALPADRMPAAVEAAAYFVIAESLANIMKHANAEHVWVRIDTVGGELVVEAGDDGDGGADEAGGSGLRGLRDRVAATGGTLTVDSPHGSGTTVRASFPLVTADLS
ncbi:MAG: histidine kinase [Pseudolysinimonas sp.]